MHVKRVHIIVVRKQIEALVTILHDNPPISLPLVIRVVNTLGTHLGLDLGCILRKVVFVAGVAEDTKGLESRQRIHELCLSFLHLCRVPRFQNIPIATLDVIPYLFHCCGDPVSRLSYRRA